MEFDVQATNRSLVVVLEPPQLVITGCLGGLGGHGVIYDRSSSNHEIISALRRNRYPNG